MVKSSEYIGHIEAEDACTSISTIKSSNQLKETYIICIIEGVVSLWYDHWMVADMFGNCIPYMHIFNILPHQHKDFLLMGIGNFII